MFHHKFLETSRHEVSDVENLNLVSDEQFADVVRQAHDQAKADNPMFALPTGAMLEDGVTGAVFDGHIRKKIHDWFQTPQGQAFKVVLKKILMAIIIGLISGS